jgi:hypothetical protein
VSLISRVYYTTPLYCGELFRATIGSVYLVPLVCLIGLPVLYSVALTAWVYPKHSTVVMKVMAAKFQEDAMALNWRNEFQSRQRLLDKLRLETSTASPQDRAVAQAAIYVLYADGVLVASWFIWWEFRKHG